MLQLRDENIVLHSNKIESNLSYVSFKDGFTKRILRCYTNLYLNPSPDDEIIVVCAEDGIYRYRTERVDLYSVLSGHEGKHKQDITEKYDCDLHRWSLCHDVHYFCIKFLDEEPSKDRILILKRQVPTKNLEPEQETTILNY